MRSLAPQFSAFLLCLLISSVATQNAAQADELFSNNGLDSVFAPVQPTQPVAPQQPAISQQPAIPQQPVIPQRPVVPQAPVAPRQVTKNQLPDFLRAAGYTPEKVSDELYTIELKKDTWTFPIAFTISTNKQNLWAFLLLKTVDANNISPGTLLGLMEANNKYGPAYFTYSTDSKRIDLNRALNNNNLSPAELKGAVDLLVEIAILTSDLWGNPQGNAGSQQAPTQPTQPVAPTQPVQPTQPSTTTPYWQTPTQTQQPEAPLQKNLNGKWACTPQKGMTIGLRIDSDGTFVLYTDDQNGQENKSTGRYTLSNGTLKLVGDDGTTLAGTFVWKDSMNFVFSPTTGGSLAFFRLE